MNFIASTLKYSFMQNALIVSVLSSISCGILGTYIVNKKMVFISSSISHASYGGIGIGLYLISVLGLPFQDPMPFALVFSIFSGILIIFLKDKFSLKDDLSIGIIMSFGMAVGIIFSSLTPGYQADISTYLFGNILLSSKSSILYLIILDSLTISIFFIFYKAIIYTSFDENFYTLYGISSKLINYLMIILISSAIIINIKTIGIILIVSILTIPQAIASMIAKRYSSIIFLSILFSFLGITLGLFFSYQINTPSGPTIILSLIFILLAVKIIKKFILTKSENNI